MADKKALIKGITPRGVAQWPKLNKPDEYQGKKFYKTNLIVGGDDAAKLIEKINEATDAVFAETKADLEKKLAEAKTGQEKNKIKKSISELVPTYPFEADVDDEGNETDGFVFKFKCNAEYKDKVGALKPIKLNLFDAKGKETHANVWGGSVLKVAYVFAPYYTAASGKVGISLRMEGIQIIDLKTGGGGRTASGLGFGEEEGWESDEDEGGSTFGDESGEAGATEDDDF